MYNAALLGSLYWHTLHFLRGDRSHLCDVSTMRGKSLLGVPRQAKWGTKRQTLLPHQAQTWYGAAKCSTCRKLVVLGLYLLDLML